jgi:acyl carrier protein
MLTEVDIRNVLKEVLKSDKPDTWGLEFDFRKEGELDSLDHVTFLLRLAESHGLTVPDQDVDKLTSIKQVLDYVENRAAK